MIVKPQMLIESANNLSLKWGVLWVCDMLSRLALYAMISVMISRPVA